MERTPEIIAAVDAAAALLADELRMERHEDFGNIRDGMSVLVVTAEGMQLGEVKEELIASGKTRTLKYSVNSLPIRELTYKTRTTNWGLHAHNWDLENTINVIHLPEDAVVYTL